MSPARGPWLERWQAAWADAPGPARVRALLSAPDAGALVRSLPAQDLYLLIKEVGVEDCAPLVALCTGEQVQAFLDLDAWRGDRFDPARYAGWVLALRHGGCAGLPRLLLALDPEVQALALRQLIYIQELDEEGDDPEPLGAFIMDTPDRCYRVSAATDNEELIELVRVQLGATLARGPLHLSAYLSQVAWELPSALEEEGLRLRNGRLEDLGFMPPDEALALLAPYRSMDEALKAAGGGVAGAAVDTPFPRAMVVRDAGGGLLAEALALLPPEQGARVAQDLVHVTNGALAAWRVDPGEPSDLRDAARRAMAHVELALRRVAGADAAEAAAVLGTTSARTLFRVAQTMLFRPAKRAAALLPALARLPVADQAFVENLAARPPARPDGGPWRTPAEVDEAETRLSACEALAARTRD